MEIYVVRPGDTVYRIARRYGVPVSQILIDNQISQPEHLVVGQALVVQMPRQTHPVAPGDTLAAIARQHGITLRQLYRNNPILGGEELIYPGQTLVIAYEGTPKDTLSVNGYAYPYIDKDLLTATVPYLTDLTPFTYEFDEQGELTDLQDQVLIAMAEQGGAAPIMHLSNLTDQGFSTRLASLALGDGAVQQRILRQTADILAQRGYRGLDVDFENVAREDAQAYAAFLEQCRQLLAPGMPLVAALAPKTFAGQPGLLFEGHDYKAIGQAVDQVLLMTYEWGYAGGPPMAIAPLPNVRQVVEYALTEIPARKIWLGVPNYGYDWPLPYVAGQSRARSLSSQQAVALARRYGAAIQYDSQAQAPWFRYTDDQGRQHEVWFEDARSIQAKLALVPQYGLWGVGYWNLMREFPQNWRVLNGLYHIREREDQSSSSM